METRTFDDAVFCVLELLAGKTTCELVYSEVFEIILTFTITGEISTNEQTPDGYEMDPSESEMQFVSVILRSFDKLKELKAAVPEGNWRDLGGDKVMAEAVFRIAFAQQYVSK